VFAGEDPAARVDDRRRQRALVRVDPDDVVDPLADGREDPGLLAFIA
jgi:hypothetical protein